MSHRLEIRANGKASFAYDASQNKHPWHLLGTRVDGLMTPQQALELACADYTVRTCPVYMDTPSGPVEIPGKFSTYRPHPLAGQPILDDNGNPVADIDMDGVTPRLHPAYQHLGFVTDRYQITQHDQLLKVAAGIIEAREGDACVDTLGVLDDGKRLIGYLKFPTPVEVIPGDNVEFGLGMHTRHDGRGTTTFFLSTIRIVCNNTVTWAEGTAAAVYALPHTIDPSDDKALAVQARVVLGLADEWTSKIIQNAQDLYSVRVDARKMRKIINSIWPKRDDLTAIQEKRRATRDDVMMGLWKAPQNSGGPAGKTGWAAVQTIGEYFDHYRHAGPGGPEARAKNALGLTSNGDRSSILVKEAVNQLVLSMA